MLSQYRQPGRPIFAMDYDHRVTVGTSLLIVGIETTAAFSQPLPKGRRFHKILLFEVPDCLAYSACRPVPSTGDVHEGNLFSMRSVERFDRLLGALQQHLTSFFREIRLRLR